MYKNTHMCMLQEQQQRCDWDAGVASRVQELLADVNALDSALAESTSRERQLQAKAGVVVQ